MSPRQTGTGAPPPWYRQAWPWFLISVPAVTVVAGIVTIVLAVRSDDGVIAADYYKRGLAINTELSRTQRAQDLGLGAEVHIEGQSAGDRIRVRLHARTELPPEATLQLRLLHPGRSGADRTAVLARLRVDGRRAEYSGTWKEDGTEGAPVGAGARLVIEAPGWRLDGTLPENGRTIRLGAGAS
ncbi:MAG TPA: FixH family protein [Burkholderiaceae bacterium]|nr:FixH family protein [Burkholderiaceae bacterium]